MKKRIKKIIIGFILLGFFGFGIYSCSKSSMTAKQLLLSNQEIKALASSIGNLHNALVDKASNQVDLKTVSGEEFRKKIYSAKIDGYNLKYFDSKIVFEKAGINNIDTYVDNMEKLTVNEKAYLKDICYSSNNFTTLADKNTVFNELIDRIVNDATLSYISKIKMACTAEVGRNSMMYWHNSRTDINNPYFKAFGVGGGNGTAQTNILGGLTPSAYVDICAYAVAFDTYLSHGYTEIQAMQSAAQDGAYQSGLYSIATSQP